MMRPLLTSELRRTWRGPLPWILVAAAPAVWLASLLLGDERNPGGWQASALMQHSRLVAVLPVLMTLLSVYLVREAQRDRRQRTEALSLGWPVASWQWALMRTLALGSVTMAVWLVLTLLQAGYTLCSYASVAGAAGAFLWGRMLRDIGITAVDLLASCLGAQATAQVAAAFFSGMLGLVLVVLYRMGVLVGPAVVVGTLQWPHILLISPELATWAAPTWRPYSEAFGLAPYEALFFSHRLFWICGSLALLAALVFVYRNRRDRWAVRSPVWACGALAVGALAVLPYVNHVEWQIRNFAAVIAAYGDPGKPTMSLDDDPRKWRRPHLEVGAAADDPVPVWYQIDADLAEAPDGRFQVVMGVELKAPATEIPLTLRRLFAIESVAVDGEPVALAAVERDGDHLRVPLGTERAPGDQVVLALSYSGTVAEWRIRDMPEVSAIAREGMLVVPGIWGWYPIPGEFTLAYEVPMTSYVYRQIVDRERTFHRGAVPFEVTLQAPAGIRSVAGFEPLDEPGAAGSRWRLEGAHNQVSLLGGDWWSLERDGITYLVPPEYLDTWETATADLHRLLTVMMDWVGPDEVKVVPLVETVADREVVEEGDLRGLYQAAPERKRLVGSLFWWLRMHYPSLEAERWYLRGLTEAEAFRVDAELFPLPVEDDVEQALKAWAEATPIPEQKRQLRELFQNAIVSPETDSAAEGGGEL